MFDNFVASLKSQTSQFGSNISDLRNRIQSTGSSLVKRSNTVNECLGSSTISSNNSLPKSGSSHSIPSAPQQSLKWSGQAKDNKKQWLSSTSLEPSKAASNTLEENLDAETETVFRNPTHFARDDSEDDEEPCLIDKFDRALASVRSIENV